MTRFNAVHIQSGSFVLEKLAEKTLLSYHLITFSTRKKETKKPLKGCKWRDYQDVSFCMTHYYTYLRIMYGTGANSPQS